jgi:hypothetical protein
MLAIQEREASSKAEADKILAETEPVRSLSSHVFFPVFLFLISLCHTRVDQSLCYLFLWSCIQALPIRQFLLTNSLLKDGKVSFRVPLELLRDAIPEIGEFPFSVGPSPLSPAVPFLSNPRAKADPFQSDSIGVARRGHVRPTDAVHQGC